MFQGSEVQIPEQRAFADDLELLKPGIFLFSFDAL